MEGDLKMNPIHIVAAKQWKKSVELAKGYLKNLDNSRVYTLSYESFVKSPETKIKELLAFLSADETNINVYELVKNVSSNNIEKWKKDLSQEELDDIKPIISPTLSDLDYK